MRALIDASNGTGVRALIDQYYDSPIVQGFALGVHGNYISTFRSEHGRDLSVNDILNSGLTPKEWPELCLRENLPATLSPIYVVIYVTMPPNEFRSRFNVPTVITPGDHLVIVETKGPFIALADRSSHRPIKGGISVSNAKPNIAGTLGGLLEDTATGEVYLSSCNHVLYDSGTNDVIQQGRKDGGVAPSDTVAQTTYAVPLKPPAGFSFSSPFNSVDAALAKRNGVSFNRDVRIIGRVTGIVPKNQIELGDEVVFVGKESDRQEARVYRFVARLKVDILGTIYNFGEVFEIESRTYLYVGSLSRPGDSGSWVVKEVSLRNNELYGLLIAGTGQFSVCCFIETVLDEFNKYGPTFDLA
jgi:hypothetical protein